MKILHFLFFFILITFTFAQAVEDSGGELSPEQAAYDVKFYDINLSFDPVNPGLKLIFISFNLLALKNIA